MGVIMLVDTLVIAFESVDYQHPNLTIEPPAINANTGEISSHATIAGMRAKKAYLNLDKVHFTANTKPLRNGETLLKEYVQFSAPKVLGLEGEIITDFTAGDLAEAVAMVQHQLKENGIIANGFNGRLWRVDTACDITAEYPFVGYYSVFNAMDYRLSADSDLGSTYRTGNKSVQWCIYDKRAELETRNQDTQHLPDNFIRFEYRMRKPSKLKGVGFSNVTSLLENYDNLKAETHQGWCNALFSDKWDNYSDISSAWLEMLTISLEGGSIRWVENAIKQLGFIKLKEDNVKPKHLQRFLLDKGVSHVTAKKYADRLRFANLSADSAKLYAELKAKVTAQLT